MDTRLMMDRALPLLILVGTKIVGAILLWIVGRFVIGIIKGIVGRSLVKNPRLDATFISYVDSALAILLNILLIVAVLGFFGVQTATFAGLIAAAGVTIGVAWSGLLSNFAAGVFLVVLRPFKKGDAITGGGFTGKVEAISLFATTIITGDNVRVFIGNNKLFIDSIQNYSASEFRRVNLAVPLHPTTDVALAIRVIKARLATIPNVLPEPAPIVEIQEFTNNGPVLAVKPACQNDHYGEVYFETTRAVREEFVKANFPPPVG